MTTRTRPLRWLAAARMSLVAALAALGAGCDRSADRPEVVLYSSVDDALLRQVVEAYEAESGVDVRIVGDTEATKTTGLVQRLIAEREHPRADVWWSSEAMGTVRLADEGVLEPYTSGAGADIPGGWPEAMRGRDGLWYSFASRARVLVYNTQRLPEAEAPRTLAELTDPKWRGRVGMARPEFGTTRGHMAALLHADGPEAFRAWLEAMKANGLRLYDGNATIVRAVAQGEIDVGLTDTDDVWAGQRNGWPVAAAFERRADEDGSAGAVRSRGALLMPNTVAKVRGGPNPERAGALIDFLLSERSERMIAETESRNLPVRPALAAEFPDAAVPEPWTVDWQAVADSMPEAMRIVDEVLGPG